MNDASQRTRDRLDAAKWLADRGFGKAPLPEVAEHEAPLDLSKLSDSELEELERLVIKAEGAL